MQNVNNEVFSVVKLSLNLLFIYLFKQYLALATALFSSHAQESAPLPLSGNYRKTQLMDNRVVLVSFQQSKYNMGWLLLGKMYA